MKKIYLSKVWLQLKIKQRRTLDEIAKEAGVSDDTIRRMLNKYGLKL